MELSIFAITKGRADRYRFLTLVGISLLLHTFSFLLIAKTPMFRRRHIDPEKIYHVRMLNLSDLPISMRQRLGSPGGGLGAGGPGLGKPGGGAAVKPKSAKSDLQGPKTQGKPAEQPKTKENPKPSQPPTKATKSEPKAGNQKSANAKPQAPPEKKPLTVPSTTKPAKAKSKRSETEAPSFENRWDTVSNDSFWDSDADSDSSTAQASSASNQTAGSGRVEYRFDNFAGGGGGGDGTGGGGDGLPGTAGSIGLDDTDFVFVYYLTIIKDKIGQNWNPPSRSGQAGETRRVTIYFKIQKNGSVTQIAIEQDSGIPMLDQSALRAVQVSAPFPPLPYDFDDDTLGIHFGFECSF